MSPPRDEIRFWHFADLHLGLHDGCAVGWPCRRCISERILAILAQETERTRRQPHLVLFAGDILNLRAATSETIKQVAEPLQAFIGAAEERGAVVVGVTGDRKHDPAAWRLRKVLEWDWLLRRGQTKQVHGVWVTGLPGSAAESRKRKPRGVPSVLLTHCDAAPAGADAFSYCALGHHHQYKREGNAARPGHLVSLWDGPGKAWPTYFIQGTLSGTGEIDVQAVPLEEPPYNAPATRQFFAEHVYQQRRSGVLVLVHAPSTLRADWVKEPECTGEPRLAAFQYGTVGAMSGIVREVAGICPNDVFVTPSPARSVRKERIVCFGHQLLSDPDLFAYFSSDIPKAKDGAQTSDRAGVTAWQDPGQMVTLENLWRWQREGTCLGQ
jgi:hypothetical protein